MSTPLLQQVLNVVSQNPHSGQALLLFALCKTLDIEKGGHMYLLVKLKEISSDNRKLAYQLMEYMAEGHIGNEEWQQLIIDMENLIRG